MGMKRQGTSNGMTYEIVLFRRVVCVEELQTGNPGHSHVKSS